MIHPRPSQSSTLAIDPQLLDDELFWLPDDTEESIVGTHLHKAWSYGDGGVEEYLIFDPHS